MKDYEDLSDADLIRLYQEGDDHAFTCLVERKRHKLYALFYFWGVPSILHADIAQEIFLRISQKIKSNYLDYDTFDGWFKMVAYHYIVDQHRKHYQYFSQGLQVDDFPMIAQEDHTPSQLYDMDEFRAILTCHLTKLPPHYADVIDKRYYRKMLFREIAAEAGCKTSVIIRRLERAVKRLREELLHDYTTEELRAYFADTEYE